MKRNILHTLWAAAVLLTACTQDEPADSNRLPAGAEGTPIVFTATGLTSPSPKMSSRATVDGDWQGVDTVAVMIDGTVKPYAVTADAADNTHATLSRADDPFYWTSRNPITVSAWWPLDDTDITQMPAVVVAGDQSTLAAFQGSDFIAAIDYTVQFDNPTLTFAHRTARVAVTLKPGTGFTGVDGATVSLTGLSNKSGNPSTIGTYYTGNTHEALAVPQTVAAGKPFIQVMLNGTNYIYCLPEELIMAAGKRYTYAIRVNDTGLTLEGCTIGDWADGGSEEGDATILDYTISDDGKTYTVYNAKGLLAWNKAARNDLTQNCTLAADIDLTAIDWTPIGDYNNKYTGTFDGGGHTITGLTIDLPNQDDVGLIGCLGGKVQNLTLAEVEINGKECVGGVAGENYGTVTGCYATGKVSGTGDSVGGVAGYNSGTVTACYATGDVSGNYYVGGVAGFNDTYGTVTGCTVSGIVSGTGSSIGYVYAGGVVGYNSGTVTGCYATGDVSGTTGGNRSSVYVGGVVGYNYNGAVTGCYAMGNVTGTGDYVGGVAGTNIGAMTACYWSNSLEKGIGSGSGDVTKVDGMTVTWVDAQRGMNEAIDKWNGSNLDNQCNWHYAGATETTPPTLAETSNP